MSINTNLKGRLRNTELPKTHGLLPVFEAVVNSIHAIEELGLEPLKGAITLEIIRTEVPRIQFPEEEKKRGPEAEAEIDGFRITDNGVGFNNDNMASFETLDSEHKYSIGGRGVGRLLWLKAFEKVEVSSYYRETNNACAHRDFVFDREVGVANIRTSNVSPPQSNETTVYLKGFRKYYKEYARKTTESIANLLLEHCLWYFIRQGGAPGIRVRDASNNISLHDVYDTYMVTSSQGQEIRIKDHPFSITHLRLRTHSLLSHQISYCANSRVVKEENITGKIPGLFGRLNQNGDTFIYSCYVGSTYLDDHVRSERIGFDFIDQKDGLFSETELSLADIRNGVLAAAREFLSESLLENQAAGKERVTDFVASTAPKYRPILSRLTLDELSVDPNISNKELDLALHNKLSELEAELVTKGHEVMVPKAGENPSDYEKRVQAYLETASDIKKSDLASYVSHRRVIIDLLESALQRSEGKAYQTEDVIHKLIIPMGKNSNDILPDSANLWIVDERLAFHDYLTSDTAIRSMPITGSDSPTEPDIVALNVFDNPILVSEGNTIPLASIVVIEMKRPMRDDAKEGKEKDPIEQALGYLDRIREGKVLTAAGRPIPSSDAIPGFCYIICDITPSIARRCKMHDGILTSDGLGYFFYNKSYKAYVEVISFTRLINAAKERNRAFFDKLGLPAQ